MVLTMDWTGTSPPDGMLLALCAGACALVLGWGAIGAPQLPKIWVTPVWIVVMMPGLGLLLTVSERYEMMWSWLVGAGAAVAFMVLGCAVTWMVAHLRSDGRAGQLDALIASLLVAGTVFLFCGVLFFQPLVLLINARGEARPALVQHGKIVGMYETHGKGAAPYVQFTGAAAAWGNTFTPGEFKISWDAYRKIHLGDRACVTIHTGLFRLRWWVIDDCGRGARMAAVFKAWGSGRHAEAIGALEKLTAADPQVLDGLTEPWILDARRAMIAAPEFDLHMRLLAMLASPRYVPSDPNQQLDSYDYDYALIQARAGNNAQATATLARIDDPVWLMRLAGLYLLLDDGQDMVDLLKPVKPGLIHPQIQATDDERWQWWWDMSRAYQLLGRYDDAVRSLRTSMTSGEVNENNRGVLLDIAHAQLDFGHAQDALKTLAELDKRPDGWTDEQEAFLRRDRACANARTGKADAAQADMVWLRDHPRDAMRLMFSALMCTGNEGDAAAIVMRDVQNPNTSASARLNLSKFAPWPASFPGEFESRDLARIAMRADVRQEIDRAGGTGTFDIPPL